MIVRSNATVWSALADDMIIAIDRLEASINPADSAASTRSILLTVAPNLQSVALHWCDPDGKRLRPVERAIQVEFRLLPDITDAARDDGVAPPNASIDRAISKACAEMFSWSKDPETFELIEKQRFRLFLCWPGGMPSEVDQFAYGLWDA